MAKEQGVSGWHSMRKEQLVKALLKAAKKTSSRSRKSSATATARGRTADAKKVGAAKNGTAKNGAAKNGAAKNGAAGKGASARKVAGGKNGAAGTTRSKPVTKTPRVASRIRRANEERQQWKDLSVSAAAKRGENGGTNGSRNGRRRGSGRDRVVLMVRDPYWLHVCWEFRRQSIERVRAAMSEQWHTAKPALRLLEVSSGGTTNVSERVVRQVEIHGGVNNWYLHVTEPPRSFRVDIGYVAENGRFYSLSRSNSVTTPRPGSNDTLDHNWSDIAKDYEKVYGMSGGYEEGANSGDLKELFEERLGRPMGSSLSARYGISADAGGRHSQFVLNADAELIIYGQAKSDAHVTLAGQPLKLRPDGSFTVRRSLPDRRQVLPLVASSRDGLEQRTVILAIERNTKVMEPITRDSVS
jgi:hypothetical protein